MKNKSIILIAAILLLFGISGIVSAATLDVTVDGITITGTEGIKNEQGNLVTVPSGVILLWSGSIATIPAGWQICDGTNGTPDLTDRFVIHADADLLGTNNVGDTGTGEANTSGTPLAENQIPAHSHRQDFGGNLNGYNRPAGANLRIAGGFNGGTPDDAWYEAPTGKTGGGIDGEAVEHSHAISNYKPKYYALAYIMKL